MNIVNVLVIIFIASIEIIGDAVKCFLHMFKIVTYYLVYTFFAILNISDIKYSVV